MNKHYLRPHKRVNVHKMYGRSIKVENVMFRILFHEPYVTLKMICDNFFRFLFDLGGLVKKYFNNKRFSFLRD